MPKKPAQLPVGWGSIVPTAPGKELEGARLLPVDLIAPNPRQSRQAFDPMALQELQASIQEHGVLEPILVRAAATDGKYIIVAGERRYRAAKAAGKTEIPALIREDLTEIEAAFITALENLQRQDLDIEDEARQFQYLLKLTGLSQRALADQLGINHVYLWRRLRLLERPDLLAAIRAGTLTQEAALRAATQTEADPAPALVEREDLDTVFHAETRTQDAPVFQHETRDALADQVFQHETPNPDTTPVFHAETRPAPGRAGAAPLPAVPPRYRYVENARRELQRIKPDRVEQTERAAWAKQLEDLASYAAQLAQAIRSEE